MRTPQSLLVFLCVAMVGFPPNLLAQAVPQQQDRWYSGITRRYMAPEEAAINLGNSARIEALLRGGRLYLSLQDAVALALENNLDIELQRYGPRIAEADLLRAQAGGVVRGVPTNISQGPTSTNSLVGGGTVGGGGGGGGGGAAGGTTVLFSGSEIPSLDETLFVNYTHGHTTQPLANQTGLNVPFLVQDNRQLTTGVQKEFLLGTSMSLGYAQQKRATNSSGDIFNPATTGNLNFTITQPLLRGFGVALNSRNIRIAKNNVKVSDLVFRQQVIATVANVVNQYSDLVSFSEDVKVRQQALSLAEKLYNDNRKQVEIGTLAPIEIVRAEAEVARSQQELTQAETQLLQQETILKNYLSRTGVMSPSLADARIVATDRLSIPDVEAVQPIQDLVTTALGNRPELTQTQLQIENSRISLAGSKSQLLPSLNLVGRAVNNGLAGPVSSLPLPPGQALRSPNPALVGNISTLWTQLFTRDFPDYSLGFQLSIPIRNRAARADIIRDQLSLRQAELRQRQEMNQIRVDVQNAVIGLQQSRARYQSAQKSRVLQEQTLDAEQKKYTLGASTIFFVIQAQRDLSQAQAAEVAALSTYNRARVALDRATGQILGTYAVNIDEAMKGRISTAPAALPALEP